jgi:ribosome-associated translation inhibitor RaiA
LAGKNLRAVSEMDQLFASIDIAKDEMVRELQSNKDKRVSLIRRGGAKIKNLIKGVFNRAE